MNNLECILNEVYCLSQSTAYTLGDLRIYPNIARNPHNHSLYILLEELHQSALETCEILKAENLKENELKKHLNKMLIKALVISEIHEIFMGTVKLPEGNILIRQLREQMEGIMILMTKLVLHTVRILEYRSEETA